MALMARSIEMSFSASRLRRTLRSMSIGPLLVRAVVPVVVVQRGKLDLYPPRAELRVAEFPALPVDLEPHSLGIRPGDASRYSRRRGPAVGCRRGRCHERCRDQAADRAPPVLRLSQRAIHARR